MLFPGTFNPWHAGHAAIAEKAMQITTHQITLELCTKNVDKPDDDILSFERRFKQVAAAVKGAYWLKNIAVSNAPRFIDKIRWLRDSVIVVGFDTITRIGDWNKYYDNFEYADFIQQLNARNIRFLVFHRLTSHSDIRKIESELLKLCSFAETDVEFQQLSSRKMR